MITKNWSKENIFKVLENFSVATGHYLVELTQNLENEILPTWHKDLSTWMDTVNSHQGGWYHRVKHGHDFFGNIGDIYDKFGVEGVLKYPYELFKDFSTPHGIPLPGTQFLVKKGIIGAKSATEWMSINMAEAFSGGIALYSTFKLYKKKENGEINNKKIIWASIGVGIKITAGVVSTNPVLIISGAADAAILITDIESAIEAFKNFFDWELVISVASTGAVATAVGAGSAAGTMGIIGVVGTASTGTAISTLSGVAASNATLAAIGGGSITSGGLGIAGGIAILSGGGIVIGATAGYFAYKYIKNKKKAA